MTRHQAVLRIEVVPVHRHRSALEVTTEVTTAAGTRTLCRRHLGPTTTVEHAARCVARHHGLVEASLHTWVPVSQDELVS